MLVLLFRGRLLERFPNLSIYAYPITDREKRARAARARRWPTAPAR